MAGIELTIPVERDSDNSYSGRAEVTLDGDILRFHLLDPERVVGFSLRRLKLTIATLKADAAEGEEP